MRTYARVVENTVVELFSTDGDISQMFHPDLLWVDITEVIPAPQIAWSANFGTLGWVYSSPEVRTPDSTLKTLAKKWLAGFSGQP